MTERFLLWFLAVFWLVVLVVTIILIGIHLADRAYTSAAGLAIPALWAAYLLGFVFWRE